MEKLNAIQIELKALKDKKNNFGGFNYRNIESIYTELKPLLVKHNAHLKMTSDLVQMGDTTYIKVTGTYVNLESGYEETATSFAAVDFNHKGMSAEQAVGSSQTYASKYCLNHLFLLDDGSDDPDAKEPKDKEEKKPSSPNFKDVDNINTIEELAAWYRNAEPQLKSDAQKEAAKKVCARRKAQIINNQTNN